MQKILVVDDEPSIRFLILSALEDEGYQLSEAKDGLEALQAVHVNKPDLIILDVMMPGMSGYELCAQLRQDPATRDILVLMLTAKGQEKDRLQSQQAGADYYLRKPFSPLDMIEIVSSLLDRRGA